jgi:hypothetical protein
VGGDRGGLVFWVVLGTLVTTWYDRRRLYRMPPDLMAYVHRAVRAYQQERREPPGRNGVEPGSNATTAADTAPSRPPLSP